MPQIQVPQWAAQVTADAGSSQGSPEKQPWACVCLCVETDVCVSYFSCCCDKNT